MPDFMFAYHGGKAPETPQQGAEQMAKWKAWVAGLGDAMVNPGTPLGKSWTVGAGGVAEGGGPNPLMGYSIVKAANTDAALAMATSCPLLAFGTIEVAEMKQM